MNLAAFLKTSCFSIAKVFTLTKLKQHLLLSLQLNYYYYHYYYDWLLRKKCRCA